ncbi:uncharacterized protein LOC127009234 [Eriocheir sinensis]|uniref:uncharacterized protein LOC127009234 n=1 Tax=Eriocheir sinensis TaxID=95602 RepID=UPI0021CA9325|nr:uncharacterized protein LOC127009234 [Eriocheir sinensis]
MQLQSSSSPASTNVLHSPKEEETDATTERKMKFQTDGGSRRQFASLRLTLLPCRTLGLLCLLTLAAAASAVLTPTSLLPLTDAEESLCGKKSAVPVCRMKLSQCAPLDTLLTPLLGSPQTIISCTNTTGMPLKADFLASLGRAMMTGTVDAKLMKKPTGDAPADYAIRQCVLNSTGMLGGDLQLNRGAIAAQVASMSPPSLRAAVGLAIDGCPEPVDLKVMEYLKCLKKTCVASIPDPTPVPPSLGSPLSDGTKAGGGLGTVGTI